MTLPAYDHDAMKARLERLDERRQLAFGAACCERLLQKITHHRLMQRELEQQERDLTAVSLSPSVDVGFLARLRNSWSCAGKSNLDLP